MNKNEILEVLSAFSASSATLLQYQTTGTVLTLDKSVYRGDITNHVTPNYAVSSNQAQIHTAVSPVSTSVQDSEVAPAPPVASVTSVESKAITSSVSQGTGKGTPVKSQLVGVYYASPTPDSDPFIKVGQDVKEGDTLCIIEAMKVMNEIKAPRDGKVLSILVESGDLVEFGQVLVEIE